MIGGCIDTIGNLLGTPYEDVAGFIDRYGDDGILWYLENCEMPSTDIYRRLFQMREAGWFDKISGLIVGRTGAKQEGDFVDRDAYLRIFSEMDIPVVAFIAGRTAPILDAAKRIVGVVLVFRDVTKTRRIEKELLKIEKLE